MASERLFIHQITLKAMSILFAAVNVAVVAVVDSTGVRVMFKTAFMVWMAS